jgi:hypothetical protein
MKFTTTVPDYNSATPETVIYSVKDQFNMYLPTPLSLQITITPVNDAPVITMSSQLFSFPVNAFQNINGINISDVDAGNSLLSVNITSDKTSCNKIWMRSTTNLVNYVNTSNQILFDGTVGSIDAAFAALLVYEPKATGSGFITVTVNDNGNTGSGGALKTTMTIAITVTTATGGGKGTTDNVVSGPSITGAVVGGTAALSSGLYGVYAYMKKRKLLPEDTDPWEADADFDKTLENPLYSGTPSTTSAASVTLVTSDT